MLKLFCLRNKYASPNQPLERRVWLANADTCKIKFMGTIDGTMELFLAHLFSDMQMPMHVIEMDDTAFKQLMVIENYTFDWN